MPNVFSKLANSQKYTGYQDPVQGTEGQVNTPDRHVHIKGGANLADKFLQTPLGVMTTITDDEATFLRTHNIFKIHERNGFVTIENSAGKEDVDAVVADMGDKADDSAPLTPSDYEEADGLVGEGNNGQARLKDAVPVKGNGRK